ncbi:MAG TPA: LPS export ABC transporter periplasmic protein LptC [Candidatus Binatia bacterium]|nr:LPS export ABC transporter periplasmic protein LptC [Candidatus Binatia bacterium]
MAISALLGMVAFKVGETVWQREKKSVGKELVKNALNLLPDEALQIKDFHRAQVEGDRKIWEVFGDEARYNKDEKLLAVQKARILFYQQDTIIEAIGKQGNLWMGEGQSDLEKAQLLGDVQVTFRGYVLTTNEILYFKSRNIMVLPSRVSIKGEGMELDGSHMEISLNDEKLRLNGNVRTKVVPNKLPTKGRFDEDKAG